MEIKEVSDYNIIPINLLLLADPEVEHINTYLPTSTIFAVFSEQKIIGVIVFSPISDMAVEIMNVAVQTEHQGKGIGKALLTHTIDHITSQGYKKIEIGTGNTSINQLFLYQKLGFRISGIIHDYFVDTYQNEIYENGIQCRDMIRLEKEI